METQQININISTDKLEKLIINTINAAISNKINEFNVLQPEKLNEDYLLSRKEACRLLKISHVTLIKFVKDKKIKHFEVGKCFRYRMEDLLTLNK